MRAFELYGLPQALGALAVLVGVGFTIYVFEPPPPAVEQLGFRGVAMEKLDNPSRLAAKIAANQAPATTPAPPASPGPKASQVYQNVQVLGDLDVASFVRLMAAITEWVSPEQGCAYCHEGANFADDTLYTKLVARRMLQMNQHINGEWSDHVGDTGVTCYSCHQGKPVPENIWFTDFGPPDTRGIASRRDSQNLAMQRVAYASLPYDPFTTYFADDTKIRVQAEKALPKQDAIGTMEAEHTYGLMMHMSEGLGVNCTYCHNSRAFGEWEQSPPARMTAWHGIQMVRALNIDYLEPLGPQYPANRVGPSGDAPKANCATCHHGLPKPLNGAKMLKDYPSLAAER